MTRGIPRLGNAARVEHAVSLHGLLVEIGHLQHRVARLRQEAQVILIRDWLARRGR